MNLLEYIINDYQLASFLVLIFFILSLIASANVKMTFSKYNKVKSSRGVPAHVIARQILDSNGLYNIEVVQTPGNLTDHYDPKKQIVALSSGVFNSVSVGAIGIAAHECGHAVQHSVGYGPIQVRTAIFPVVNLMSRLWLYVMLIGLFMSLPFMLDVGIIFFTVVAIFQLVTLPVEFNASRRAMQTISSQNILDVTEQKGARKTLTAAAMTYVMALLLSIAQLLRILAASNRRRR